MPPLVVIILLLITSWSLGCAKRSSYNVHQPPVAQAERYIQTEGLSQLPNRRLAITSFGIEYDTKLLFPLKDGHGYPRPGEIHTVLHVHKEIPLNLTRERMQVLADQAYTQLVEDLQVAGYDVIPYEAYKNLSAYRSLVELAGNESPVSITFKRGDPENPVQGEALVFAPTELGWYSPAFGEIGSRLGKPLASLGSEIHLTKRGFVGAQAIGRAEVALADALNATLLKVYYVVSPVRSVAETTSREEVLPVEGRTIVGRGETRLAFRTPGAPISPPTFGKNAPPQDGNAFVRLHRDIWVNTDLKSGHALGAYLDAVGKLFVIALMTEK